jgi:O-antigen ligase
MQPHTLMHFINGYAVPFALYFALRCSVLEKKDLRPAFWIMMAMGVYLGVTAVLEIAKMSSLVFPKSINDPTLGIHFGRARGPMLQSVRLGVCLLVCLIIGIVYTICLNPWKRSRWAVAAIVVPVLSVAIGLTYTRSIWMGLIAVVGILIVLCLKGQLRRGLVIGGALAGIFGGLILGPNLVAFKREYSAAETRESTYMRAAFAYVSFEMIKDRPVAGFGFNQFNIANRTYLSDRSTNIRVESIRGYVHHNSFLSLLVDLGIIGFSLFSFMMIGFVRESWRLWRSDVAPDYIRALGLVAICCTSVHLIQMAFHEVSFSPIENSVLLGSFGLVMAAKRRYRGDQIGPSAAELENQLPSH